MADWLFVILGFERKRNSHTPFTIETSGYSGKYWDGSQPSPNDKVYFIAAPEKETKDISKDDISNCCFCANTSPTIQQYEKNIVITATELYEITLDDTDKENILHLMQNGTTGAKVANRRSEYPQGIYKSNNKLINAGANPINHGQVGNHDSSEKPPKECAKASLKAIPHCLAAALATKGFVVLGGLSGAGKTKLAVDFSNHARETSEPQIVKIQRNISARTIDNQDATIRESFDYSNPLVLSVRPDWRDGSSVIGYYNAITQKRKEEPLSQYLQACNDPECCCVFSEESNEGNKNAVNCFKDKKTFIIFDEMNLARVEYYLADILSAMELDGSAGGVRLDMGPNESKDIPWPENFNIIGTANMDETTYAFSPKVLDRCFYIRYSGRDIKLDEKDGEEDGQIVAAATAFKEKIEDFIKSKSYKDRLNNATDNSLLKYIDGIVCGILRKMNGNNHPVSFGHRARNEIGAFIYNYAILAGYGPSETGSDGSGSAGSESGGTEAKGSPSGRPDKNDDILRHALDWAVVTKILPKFHGAREDLEGQLKVLYETLTGTDFIEMKGEAESNQSEAAGQADQGSSLVPEDSRSAGDIRWLLGELEKKDFAIYA